MIAIEYMVPLVVALLALGGVVYKYYLPIRAAINALPAGASLAIRAQTIITTLVNTVKSNPTMDKTVITDFISVVTILGALFGIDVSVELSVLNQILQKV